MWERLGWLLALLLLGERLLKYGLVRRFFALPVPSPIASSDQRLPDLAIGQCDAFAQSAQTLSILQPILSGDPTLWHCLAVNLQSRSTYKREFLWLVDENDPVAIAGCQRLIDKHPQAYVRLLIYPPPPDGVNPKMFKLIAGMRQATGDLVAVLDDDTMLPDQTWEQCVHLLEQPQVGLVFGLPYYVNFSNFWSALVAAFVNGFSLITYVPYTFLYSPLTINGMFYLLKRSTLEKIGGFAGLENQLCDDYAVAQHLRSHGFALLQTPVRHAISTQVTSWRHYLRMMTRWLIFPQVSLLRSAPFSEQLLFYLFAFLPAFVPLGLLLTTGFWENRGLWGLLFAYFALNGWIAWEINWRYLKRATPMAALPLVLLMQLLLPLHTLWALLAPRRVNWRGHVLALGKGGGFSFVERRGGGDQS